VRPPPDDAREDRAVLEDDLGRVPGAARFDTFESAVERIGYWVEYYNHQRLHQGIEGLCPADRFFSIQKEVTSGGGTGD